MIDARDPPRYFEELSHERPARLATMVACGEVVTSGEIVLPLAVNASTMPGRLRPR